jgi:hypothetical protein
MHVAHRGSLLLTTIFIILRRAPLSWSVTMAGLSERRFVTFTSDTFLEPSVTCSHWQKSCASLSLRGLPALAAVEPSLLASSWAASSAAAPPSLLRSTVEVSADISVRPVRAATKKTR